MKKIFTWLGVALLVVAGFSYAYTSYLVHQHRNVVRALLKDPDSAKFQNEKLKGKWTLEGSILCGEVNAKSEMGGYSGYKLFASTSGVEAEVADDSAKKVFLEGYCE